MSYLIKVFNKGKVIRRLGREAVCENEEMVKDFAFR